MFNIKFSENSISDLIEIQEYYDEIVFGLGKKFISKPDEVINHLKSNPKIYPIIKNRFRKIPSILGKVLLFWIIKKNFTFKKILALELVNFYC